MADLAKSLWSESWWVSVVAVSIALNILSAYLYKRLDSTLGRMLSWWRSRSEEKTRIFNEEVEFLKMNPHHLPLYLQEETRERIRGIQWLIFWLLALVLLVYLRVVSGRPTAFSPLEVMHLLRLLVNGLGLLAVLFALGSIFRAARIQQIVYKATGTPTSLRE